MTDVVVQPAAVEDLARLIVTHSLPADTGDRVRRTLEPLGSFPLLGPELDARWRPLRFLLGPWRWMVIVYAYDTSRDRVDVLTIQDGRSLRAPRPS